MLAACPAAIDRAGPSLGAPFFACTWLESAIARVHSSWSAACSSANSTSCSRSHTPAAAKHVAAATRSCRSRSQAPAADAPNRSPYAAQTGSPVAPTGHRAAFAPDSGSVAAALAALARSAPTARPAPPTASPSRHLRRSTTGTDGLRSRRTGPFIQLELLSRPGSLTTTSCSEKQLAVGRQSVPRF